MYVPVRIAKVGNITRLVINVQYISESNTLMPEVDNNGQQRLHLWLLCTSLRKVVLPIQEHTARRMKIDGGINR